MFFRYSEGRDAYVLRGVGNVLGPVFQVREPRTWEGTSETEHRT